ncbi:pyruvate/2-oxoglutarate dehydrogenase [Xylariaceae sp. FL0016]|nr:pyruvate/2-oxoglutarate dehydrogenase [Xylariaceae sp. FL0016]
MPEYNSIDPHPADHGLEELKSDTYDVICIGSGWAGRVLAARVAKAVLSALIIEEELIGGDCPFWACVPSKVLLRSQDALEEAASVGGAKERLSGGPGVDVEAVFDRRDKFTSKWDDNALLVPMVEGSGAHVVRGKGRLAGEKKVTVEQNGRIVTIQARHAVAICTGSTPTMPGIPGLLEANPWNPRHATSASEAPKSLVVIGAGAVGTEMATAYAGFGTKVTLVSSTPEILARFEPEAGRVVRESFVSKGVKVHLSTKVTKVHRESNQPVKVSLSDGTIVEAEQVLVAAGRRAQTSGIGLEEFGIDTKGAPIAVDDSMRVQNVAGGWLFAGGDVVGRHPLTHGAKYHGRIMSNVILAQHKGTSIDDSPWSQTLATADTRALPQVVFTDPNIASVGYTKASAAKAGLNTKEICSPVVTLGARIRSDGAEEGWAQWVVEEGSNKLLGATLVGKDVGEQLQAFTVAVVGEMTLERLAHAIPSFPTSSEVFLNLVEAAGF